VQTGRRYHVLRFSLLLLYCFAATMLILAAGWLHADNVDPGTETYVDFTGDGFAINHDSLNLPIFVPTDYHPDRASPLVLHFHGSGGTPNTNLIRLVTDRSGYIIVGMEYLRRGEPLNVALDEQLRFNRHVIERVSSLLHVNPRLIFISGMSRGGFATSMYGFTEAESRLYRGYMMFAGETGSRGRPLHKFMKDKPVLIVHGEADATVAIDTAVQASADLRLAGADLTFIRMPGVGHQVPQQYWPQILQWLLKYSADPQLDTWLAEAREADPYDLPRAIDCYRKIVAVASRQGAVGEAKARLKELEEQAGKVLSKAAEAIEARQFASADRLLEQVANEFAGLAAAKDAAQSIEELHNRPDYIEWDRQMQATARQKEAQFGLRKARELIGVKDYVAAMGLLEELIRDYPETDAAVEARQQAEAMRADAAISQQFRDAAAAEDCTRWLAIAENLMKNGRADAARSYLEKIIQHYPDSTFADRARALLDQASE